ncbi:YcjF family protein [Ferrovum myxofaciens]|uniref:YcjF family protein n=1 Tax=Ferrovum myxofaciens TaxID=416213 RepID=UPI00068C5718|nr:GTPase [Ferrovum myxofaciens]
MTDNFDIFGVIKTAQEETARWIGKANLLVAGKTGVGKSTLINAIFGEDFAKTGTGQPVTQEMKLFSKEGSHISIYDSKGLELADFKKILDELISAITEINSSKNAMDHILLCWLCVDHNSARIEPAEVTLLEKLEKELGIKTIVVFTKSFTENKEFINAAKKILPNAEDWIEVHAEKTTMRGGQEIPPSGLDNLVTRTYGLLPEIQKRAFVRAQQLNLEKKIDEANTTVNWASGQASLACANPLPIPDAILIIPIQIRMMMRIGELFGIPSVDFKTLMIVLGGPLAMAGAGRQVASYLLKFIPIGGQILNATIAASITKSMGTLYIKALVGLVKENPSKHIDYTMVAERFKGMLQEIKN